MAIITNLRHIFSPNVLQQHLLFQNVFKDGIVTQLEHLCCHTQNHSKTYKSLREEKQRFEIFKSTVRTIENHNTKYHEGKVTFFMGINQFSDLTDEEFQMLFLNNNITETKTVNVRKRLDISIPDSFDWREKGAVLAVKDQGLYCGSCWAFSAIGAIEGQNAIKHNITVELSEQELVDCSGQYGNHGCFGGMMNNAFSYVKENGISSEKCYPYIGINSKCKRIPRESKTQVIEYMNINKNEEDLKEAVATIGPISVAINGNTIRHYAGGLFDNVRCPKLLNHGVLVVGYGNLNSQEYWLIKNSWGSSWGEGGYIKMSRNKSNQCGIASAPSYPIIE